MNTLRTLVVSVAMVLTGCGDGAEGSGGGSGGAARLLVTFDISGSDTVSTTVTRDLPSTEGLIAPRTCDDYLKGGNGNFPLPLYYGPERVGGRSLQFLVFVRNYTGPGTYTGTQVHAESGVFLAIDGAFYGTYGGSPRPTVTIRPDASGEFVFMGLNTDTSPKKTISGKISWICRR